MSVLKYFIISSCIFIASCATPNAYNPPQQSTPHATIRGMSDNGLFSWKIVHMVSIDGKEIGTLWSSSSKVRLDPGPHTIKVYVTFKKGIGKSGYYTAPVISFNAKANQNYVIDATSSKDNITAWIVDSHGNAVSPRVSSKYLPSGTTKVDVAPLPN